MIDFILNQFFFLFNKYSFFIVSYIVNDTFISFFTTLYVNVNVVIAKLKDVADVVELSVADLILMMLLADLDLPLFQYKVTISNLYNILN